MIDSRRGDNRRSEGAIGEADVVPYGSRPLSPHISKMAGTLRFRQMRPI